MVAQHQRSNERTTESGKGRTYFSLNVGIVKPPTSGIHYKTIVHIYILWNETVVWLHTAHKHTFRRQTKPMLTIKATNLYCRNIFDTFVIYIFFTVVSHAFFSTLYHWWTLVLSHSNFQQNQQKEIETKRLATLTTRELNHVCDGTLDAIAFVELTRTRCCASFLLWHWHCSFSLSVSLFLGKYLFLEVVNKCNESKSIVCHCASVSKWITPISYLFFPVKAHFFCIYESLWQFFMPCHTMAFG